MDDFRTIVKTFEMLDDPVKRETSQNACLNLARSAISPDVARKIIDFITNHLNPARFENTGTQLGRRQEVLQQSLERILRKTVGGVAEDDVSTVPVAYRDTQQATRWPEPVLTAFHAAPAPLGMSTAMNNTSGNNLFHSLRAASTPSSHRAPAGEQGASQLEQIYAWGGEDAVRGLLELDDEAAADVKEQRSRTTQTAHETDDERACRELGERYGGSWSAPKWAGKGAPEEHRR